MVAAQERRMPRAGFTPEVAPRVIHALLNELERWQKNEAEVRSWYPWADRFVMGLPLVPWQRPFVWTEGQSRRFITSAWTGVHLGHYVLTGDRLRSDCSHVEFEFLGNEPTDFPAKNEWIDLYLDNGSFVGEESHSSF